MEASALLCRNSFAVRLAAKPRETLRVALKTLLSSPSRKRVHGETISGELIVSINIILVRFPFSGRAVKTSSVLLCRCICESLTGLGRAISMYSWRTDFKRP